MENKIIGIDIDDVISDTIPIYLQYINNKYSTNIKFNEVITLSLSGLGEKIEKNILKIGIEEFWKKFLQDCMNLIDIIPGSKEKIEELINNNFEIVLISARGEGIRNETEMWLSKYFDLNIFKSIQLTGAYDGVGIKKSEVCKTHGVNLMIDDSLDNCLDLASNDIYSYLFTKPWNSGYKNSNKYIKKINNWNEIIGIKKEF